MQNSRYPVSLRSAFTFSLFLLPIFCFAQESPTPAPQEPKIAEASDDAKNAIQVFQLPAGVTAEVFAAEPMMANPVAIDVDRHNRVYVCESYRQGLGVEDNRSHGDWLDDDLAAQTVADRLAYIKKYLGDEAIRYTDQDDLIRLLVDTSGDGKADQATVFANQFNAIEEGTGAGVLAVGGDVYFTCIPRLWKLTDVDGDGAANSRRALHDGFGVRFAFRGHDLHGLIVGPDGRLYFSIGDRGYHVNDGISDPASGAVFRCELDGSDLEVVAKGLRNPQELAFDDYGNLFTGDNNSDSGDRARMVYVVDGSDSGWRMHYQYLPDRGPFNREKIWHPYDPQTTPAYIVPPINNFADGPSGFAYYPGTGFSEHMKNRFLLCDFRGQASGSGIKTFRLKPQGAFWEIADEENSFWNMLATDCCFGPDGRLYVSDWVHGWEGLGKGRIYALSDSNADAKLVQEVQQLLSADWQSLAVEQLPPLLGHPDRRVRQQAQFELVSRNDLTHLEAVSNDLDASILSRIHAFWGIEQITRQYGGLIGQSQAFTSLAQRCLDFLNSDDFELQCQAAKIAADSNMATKADAEVRQALVETLTKRIQSENARVQYFSAIALGKLGNSQTALPILDLLKQNNNRDPLLRHAGVMGLVYQTLAQGEGLLQQAVKEESAATQLAAIVAIRKLRERQFETGSLLEALLNSEQPYLALEAARVIHDLPMEELLPQLAAFANRPGLPDPMARRVLNANYRLGTADCVARVKAFALDPSQIEARRVEAVSMLASWQNPVKRDMVLGSWNPLEEAKRSKESLAAVEALFDEMDSLTESSRNKLMESVALLKLNALAPKLRETWRNTKSESGKRAAFKCLLSLDSDLSEPEAIHGMQDEDAEIRVAALNFLFDKKSTSRAPFLNDALNSETLAERQNAIAILGRSDNENLRAVLKVMLLDLDNIKPDSRLDVVVAAENSSDPLLKKLATKLLELDEQAETKPRYDLALSGGNAARGSEIFYNRASVYCLRCHKIDGSGGDVGPNLSEIGSLRDRQYLLESLIEPNKVIAENFETVVVLDADGKIHVGVTKASTEDTLSIMTAEAIMVNIPKDEIDEIRRGESAMPNDVMKNLTLSELRDLIEFLATRKKIEQQ
ncbi:MAG: PQQ-dependent sugar dehydrogenase [Pirellulaceae bacterium]|nr:PQQ-dependent sugar dehydrogenase [Pirellulaceae bacterium]